jgi:hypothetical protein
MLDVGRWAFSAPEYHRSSFLIETHSLPTLARCYPHSFAFYVAHPIHSIRTFLAFLLKLTAPEQCASAFR